MLVGPKYCTAQQRWAQLDAKRRGIINRCEVYAALTLPKICPIQGYNQNSQQLSQDFQAIGAQAVNHLSNKMMLALFAPSRPFFRLDANAKAKEAITQSGAPMDGITKQLAIIEKDAVAVLDRKAIRPKMYEVLKHLIITGNVLLWLDDVVRVIGLRHYAVRRSMTGQIVEIVLKDEVLADELSDDIRKWAETQNIAFNDEMPVKLYKHIRWDGEGHYVMDQSLDDRRLPEKFDGKYTEETLPFRVLTWDLTDGQHYGTGLVEDYAGDFEGLSKLSTAQVQNALLASEFRWLVNPAGMTSVDDLTDSENGAALPGSEGDVVPLQLSKGGELKTMLEMTSEYVNRIGRAFLLASQLVRQAERVTAEEIRQTADELETALGGAYSRIAVDFQGPLAWWLLRQVPNGKQVQKDFDLTVVTGLDALSRNGDLEDLKLWLADMAQINNFPPQLLQTLKMDQIATALALPRRIDVSSFIKSPDELAAEQQAAQNAQAQDYMAQAGANAAASAGAAQGQS